MDHNDFDFDDDFIDQLTEFFKQINLEPGDVFGDFQGLNFEDEYYFPPPNIVVYEKKLIKQSIIWDIIEDRKKQAELKKAKTLVEEQKR